MAAATYRKARRRPAPTPDDSDYDTTDTGTEPEPVSTDDTPNIVVEALATYRQHLKPHVVLAAMAILGAFTANGGIPLIIVAPIAAIAVAAVYARVKDLGHRRAEQHGRLAAGRLSGRRADRINTDAGRATAVAGYCAAWLILDNVTSPSTVAGWIVWWPLGVVAWTVLSWPTWREAERRRLREPAPSRRRDDDRGDPDDVTVRLPARPARDRAERPRRTRPEAAPADDSSSGFELPTVHPAPPRTRRVVDLRGPADGIRAVIERRGIDAQLVGDGDRGPTITRYSIVLGRTADVADVTKAEKDFQYVLKTKQLVVHAPVEGESAIGLEVPNGDDRDLITFDEVFQSIPDRAGPLTVALGVDAFGGDAIIFDLAKGPQVLVGGETGSGKSACVNACLCSILLRATPRQVQLLLADPKKVELTAYHDIPHLVTPIITDVRRAIDGLEWAVAEMDRRYDEMARVGVRKIDDYNRKVAAGQVPAVPGSRQAVEPMPCLLVVVDELAMLMTAAKVDVEEFVCRITAEGRAAGVHGLFATQTPRSDTITGRMKANVPTRFAFRTQSGSDSGVLMDERGAEKLTGKGDGLLKTSTGGPLRRFQGPLITDAEIEAITDHWREQARLHPSQRTTTAFTLPVPDDGADLSPQEAGTAADAVMVAARTLSADTDGGEFSKMQIVGLTGRLTAAARARALTDLAPDDGSGPLTRVRKGWYTLTPTHNR